MQGAGHLWACLRSLHTVKTTRKGYYLKIRVWASTPITWLLFYGSTFTVVTNLTELWLKYFMQLCHSFNSDSIYFKRIVCENYRMINNKTSSNKQHQIVNYPLICTIKLFFQLCFNFFSKHWFISKETSVCYHNR